MAAPHRSLYADRRNATQVSDFSAATAAHPSLLASLLLLLLVAALSTADAGAAGQPPQLMVGSHDERGSSGNQHRVECAAVQCSKSGTAAGSVVSQYVASDR